MKKTSLLILLFPAFFTISCKEPAPAENIQLPGLFGDHMVLQQQLPIPVWGSADPGGLVIVTLAEQIEYTVVDKSGKWRINLKPLPAGGPFEMKIIGTSTLEFQDVMVGEVWLGSGQSNMEMPLGGWGGVLDSEDEIAAANYPQIRLYQVEKTMSFKPSEDVPATGWQICSPQSIEYFSAPMYFFGRELNQTLDLPIGLIHSSWGGTIIEAWISPQALSTIDGQSERMAQLETFVQKLTVDDQPLSQESLTDIWEAWQEEVRAKDRGLSDPDGGWSEPHISSAGWEPMDLPITWEEAGLPGLDGIVWFRKEINLPPTWQGKDLTLQLSAVDDVDSTYFNGSLIGSGDIWDAPRNYTIPSNLVRADGNVISVRVQDDQGAGGIWGDADLLWIKTSNGDSLSLVGSWNYRIGLSWDELETPAMRPGNPNHPTLLSHGMIEPLIPYGIRGALWYQGESNVGQASQYQKFFPTMIRDWRQRWDQGDFPFYFVQLANYMARAEEPGDDSWAELREAQMMALAEPNTGMAVAIDIGDEFDIHPKNKQEVGRRLALLALQGAYEQDIQASGPLYQSLKVENDRIRISFSNTAKGLSTRNNEVLQGFAIAGKDRQFRWADATIEGHSVVVHHPLIPHPVAVRYAWAANPACNLLNSAKLPAAPFRTDDWAETTGLK